MNEFPQLGVPPQAGYPRVPEADLAWGDPSWIGLLVGSQLSLPHEISGRFLAVINQPECPKVAGQRPTERWPTANASDFSLLCHFKRVIHLDTEVTDCTLKLGVSQQWLHGSEVLCTPINQRRVGPPKRMRSVTDPVQANLPDPGVNDSGVLARR